MHLRFGRLSVGILIAAGVTAAAQPDLGATQNVSIEDPFLHVQAETLVVPVGWKAEGTILRGVGCGTQYPHEVFRASSPDGLTGFQKMPEVIWYESQNEAAYTTMGVGSCEHLAGVSPSQVALLIAGTRPRAHLVSVQNDLDDATFKQGVRSQADQIARMPPPAQGGRATVSGREDVVTIVYEVNRQAVEEAIFAQDVTQGYPSLVIGKNGLPQGRAMVYTHSVDVFSIRAPKGKLAGIQDRMLQMMRSRELNQSWVAAQQAYFKRTQDEIRQTFRQMMARNAAQFQAEENRFRAQSAATLALTRSRMAGNQAVEDQIQRTGQDQIDYLAGNQYYLNPETGRTYTLPAGEGKIYQHNDGGDSDSNIRTNDGYQQLQMPSDWVQLKAIAH